jgi:hypothetical protein
MVQSWDRADLVACQAVGVPGMQLLISATLSAHEPRSLLADGIRRVSIRADEAGGVTDDEIRAYLRAGLSVQAHGIDRQYERRRLAALGLGSFCTDESVYLAGGDGYRRDTDPFAAGTYGPGHLTNLLDAGTVAPSTRGAFTDPGWWSVPPGKQPLFALQGWACPLPEPARFTLHARVRVDRPPPRTAGGAATSPRPRTTGSQERGRSRAAAGTPSRSPATAGWWSGPDRRPAPSSSPGCRSTRRRPASSAGCAWTSRRRR